MGKNLKGREIGKGICQRKDGLYVARFLSRTGTRITKHFRTVPGARNWIEESKVQNWYKTNLHNVKTP